MLAVYSLVHAIHHHKPARSGAQGNEPLQSREQIKCEGRYAADAQKEKKQSFGNLAVIKLSQTHTNNG
ncbi:hypothetical protein D3C75_1153270 [compost metagenome]